MTYRRSDGTLYQERQKLPWPADQPFRILSIDGGGIKGILPATILSHLEESLSGGHGLARHFDMIAGTSTGGIIAVGIALGIPARDILELYLTKGERIFSSAPWIFRTLGRRVSALKQVFHRRYNPAVLDHELARMIGGRSFGEAKCRLVIPAFDHNTEPCVFKTAHHPDYRRDWKEEALTVARATSAAPTFLEGLEHAGRRFWDGGVFANNPVMMAVVDALACYDVPRRNIYVFSIGCATEKPALTKQHLKAGFWGWRNAHAVASSLQNHDALGQAGLLIGRDRLLRIDADLPYSIDMDDYATAKHKLPEVGDYLWSVHKEQVLELLETEARAFQPIYGND
ncbi:MAG: CBASS cGAMP-activated phospholipase [Pseudomonadota bacterium]